MTKGQEFIIWGGAGHALVLADIISNKGGIVNSIFDNKEIKTPIENVPIYYGIKGFYRWRKENLTKKNIYGFVAIGGNKGFARMEIQKLFCENGVLLSYIQHPMSFISPSAKIGKGSQLLAFSNVSANVIIGEASILNHHTNIDHECVIGNGVHIAPGATLCGGVEISDNVLIGAGSTILPRIKIGKNVTVGSGSVVTKDIPSNSVVYGNPAKRK